MGNVDGLVDHQVKNLASLQAAVSNHTNDGVVCLCAKGMVITLYLNGLIMISDLSLEGKGQWCGKGQVH